MTKQQYLEALPAWVAFAEELSRQREAVVDEERETKETPIGTEESQQEYQIARAVYEMEWDGE